MAEAVLHRRPRQAYSAWTMHRAALGLAMLLLLLLYGREATEIVGIWWRVGDFHHCLMIPPIIGWLIWERRRALATVQPSLAWQGIAIVALGATMWLTGAAAFIAIARQAGLVVMAIGLVVALLGWPAATVLRAPLAFALFLIPVGTELEPWLQQITARLAVGMLHASGTPATVDGVFIETPAGLFQVAEACSGTAFLLAMGAFSTLVCLTRLRSAVRRAAFVAAALPVAILANGLRAYAVMQTAQHTGMDDPLVTDHLLYGWLLFAGVLALLMAAASRWFEAVPAPVVPALEVGSAASLPIGGAGLALLLLPRLWIAATEPAITPPSPPPVPARVAGWARLPGVHAGWGPHFDGATWIGQWRYRDPKGDIVDLALVLFDRQSQGREMIGFGQGATGPEEASYWLRIGTAPAPDGMRGEWLRSRGGERRYVAMSYVVDGTASGSGTAAKLAGARARLLRGDTSGRALLLSVIPAAPGAPEVVASRFLGAGGGIAAIAEMMSTGR